MTLALDTSRQLRTPNELLQLVNAIVQARDSEPETDWLEWKREADLSSQQGHAVIAKNVVGFANRHPAVAERQVGGCAYLVIGAEPGEVHGVSPVDNAVLDPGVTRFVGREVRWTPKLVEYGNKDILVVTVEPPELGDPIRSILKAHQPDRGLRLRNGDVYVRSHGRTDLATQADFDMLTRRYAAGQEQVSGIRVEPIGTVSAVPVKYGNDEIQDWCSQEREFLAVPYLPPSLRGFRSSLMGYRRDDRSPDEYTDEVEDYIDKAASRLARAAHAVALEDRSQGMELRLANGTERNFEAVRVKVEIEGDVSAYRSAEWAWPEMPRPPRAWGTPRPYDLGALTRPTSTAFGPSMPSKPREPIICNSDPTRVEFDDVDLRPSDSASLPPIHLVTAADLAGTALRAEWTATSSNADSVARGEFTIEVCPETVTPAGRLHERLGEKID